MTDNYNTVQVLIKGPDDSFDLNKDGLKAALKNAWEYPVCIIAICGDKRKGKSFILNMFLRYLIKGLPKTSLLSYWWGTKEDLHAAFEWRGGSRRNTEGIWILDKPILVDTLDGKVALYLMDTQGMFDSQTSKRECSQIFALATLMSSQLVFNLMKQIQANDLEYLDFWTQTAKFVNTGSDEAFFQSLLFLIRDFSFPDYGFGIQAGERYLQEELKESDDKTATVNENIRNLRNVFSSVNAFGMPTPHKSVTARKEEDKPVNLQYAGKSFMQNAEDLFKHLKENISPLSLNGSPMSGEQLYDYVLSCGENLLSDQVPDPVSLSESVSKFQLGKLVEQEKAEYERIMKEAMDTYEGTLSDLYKYHELQLLEALGRFDKVHKFGREDVIMDYRNTLKLDIVEIYNVLSTYFTQKLELKDSENKREEEARIAKLREDQLGDMVQRQEDQMKETAAKHARDAEEMKKRLEEQEKRFQEAEEQRKTETEEARKLLEDQQRLHKEAEIARSMEAAEAKARFEDQKQKIQKMENDNSKQAQEARKNFQQMEARHRREEQERKADAEKARQNYEQQMKDYKTMQEKKETEAKSAREQQQKMWDQQKAADDRRYEEAKAAQARTEKQLQEMRQKLQNHPRRKRKDKCIIS
uniref:Atlastin-2-like n=1 Tax=Phallusia mammillata TaxID=59560 RepID=A0A6F9D7Q2_9ASCI|nr:atlastin-2-like [Phallusia mammillata]